MVQIAYATARYASVQDNGVRTPIPSRKGSKHVTAHEP